MTKKPKVNFKLGLAAKVLIVVTVFLIAFIAYDISGFGGNIRFYSKWSECGQKPLRSGTTYTGVVPHYVHSPDLSLMRMSPEYFCTPREAELAEYSASRFQYELPNLTEGEQQRIAEDRLSRKLGR